MLDSEAIIGLVVVLIGLAILNNFDFHLFKR